MFIACKEIIKTYFKTNSKAKRFYNTLLAFLNVLKKLFSGIPIRNNYAKLINKVIENYIDPALVVVL